MEERRTLTRIGVSLLNLLTPGLGHLRIGRWELAAAFFAAALLVIFIMYIAPPVEFWAFASAAAIALAIYPLSIGTTWFIGRSINNPGRWFQQWYSVVGAMLLFLAVSHFVGEEPRYRSFRTPADGMAPTLPKGDRFFAYIGAPSELRRGDILLVRGPDGSTYVKRLAALPGDTIAVDDGVVSINGKPATLRLAGTNRVTDFAGTRAARPLKEQFPGEAGLHEIYDDGDSVGDHFGPVRVRAGHIFLLGDNRDHSADSRFSHQEFGLEQVPIADVLGWPLYHSFGSSRPMGEAINRKDMK